jgi:hypothetical protein
MKEGTLLELLRRGSTVHLKISGNRIFDSLFHKGEVLFAETSSLERAWISDQTFGNNVEIVLHLNGDDLVSHVIDYDTQQQACSRDRQIVPPTTQSGFASTPAPTWWRFGGNLPYKESFMVK